MTLRHAFRTIPLLLLTACTAPQAEERSTAPLAAPVTDLDTRLKEADGRYAVDLYFPGDGKDSLLADMITYIYRKPPQATNITRIDKVYRSYFVKQLPLFDHVYHHVDPNGVQWFYLIRPARSIDGSKRGVGGRFTPGPDGRFTEFEELFNTTVLDEKILRDKGLMLFEEMISSGGVEAYMGDRGLIEWPDDRLKYDKGTREWRFIDEAPRSNI